jgi:hypothetical protein
MSLQTPNKSSAQQVVNPVNSFTHQPDINREVTNLPRPSFAWYNATGETSPPLDACSKDCKSDDTCKVIADTLAMRYRTGKNMKFGSWLTTCRKW